jgi:peptide/nickel transport system substrate-binding protein
MVDETTDPTRPRRTAHLVLAVLLALALVAAGCGDASEEGAEEGDAAAGGPVNELEPDDPPRQGGALVFGVPAETAGWNPATDQWADAGNFVGSTIFDPLAVFTPDGGTEPYLATAIEPVEGTDFREWTITVPEGIQFHNGEALTAEVVAANLTFTFADPRSLTVTALGGVFESAEAVSPTEVHVRLTTPWSAFRSSMAGTPGYMMAPAMLAAEDVGSRNPIGTGPFVFDSWTPDDSLRVVRNDAYWRDDLPHLDSIEFRVLKDEQGRADALRTGVVTAMTTTDAETISRLDEDHTVVRDFDTEQTLAMFNTAAPPFDNVNARRAVALATDRAALVEQLGPDIVVSDSPLLAGTIWEVDDPGFVAYDADAARQAVEAYKADTGESTLSFRFSGIAGIDEQQVMQILQEQWRQVGIEATIDSVDQTTYIGVTILGQFELAYFRNYGYPDPDSNYVFWHSSTANGVGNLSINFTQHATPEIDASLDAARETDDPDVRAGHYTDVVRARNEAVVDLWLHNTSTAIVASPRVRGLNRFREQGFSNYVPKPWINEIWLEEQ